MTTTEKTAHETDPQLHEGRSPLSAGTVELVGAPAVQAWDDTRTALLGFVSRRVESPEAAEDIVQDILERVQRTDLSSITNVHAWLYRVARNAIVDHYRTRRPTVPLADHGGGREELGTDEPFAAVQELARCLRPLTDRLPADYRSAVTMVDLDGHTHRAAAHLAGISTSGMKSRVQRGRKRLADLLQECCTVETTAGSISGYAVRGEGKCPC